MIWIRIWRSISYLLKLIIYSCNCGKFVCEFPVIICFPSRSVSWSGIGSSELKQIWADPDPQKNCSLKIFKCLTFVSINNSNSLSYIVIGEKGWRSPQIANFASIINIVQIYSVINWFGAKAAYIHFPVALSILSQSSLIFKNTTMELFALIQWILIFTIAIFGLIDCSQYWPSKSVWPNKNNLYSFFVVK